MRILGGKPPAPSSESQNGVNANPVAAPPAAAPAKPPAAAAAPPYYEYRDALLSPAAIPSIPAAAEQPKATEPVSEKKDKPNATPSPLGRRTRAAREVNSDDERLQKPQANTEESLLNLLQRMGFQIKKMAEDGNCLFR